MSEEKRFSAEEARSVGERIGIDWEQAPFDVEQFRAGMDVELEHGAHDSTTDVTGDDSIITGKIALAHLNEFPDYYTRLEACVVVGELVQVRKRDLPGDYRVVTCHVGRRIVRSVLELDIHSGPELLDVERRLLPVDTDPLAHAPCFLGAEPFLLRHRLASPLTRWTCLSKEKGRTLMRSPFRKNRAQAGFGSDSIAFSARSI